jgi:hypothetical protein
MRTLEPLTPAPLLELAYDGWAVTGPLTHLWNPGRRYHAASPDARTHLRAATYAENGPFTYQLVTATTTETWRLLTHAPTPAAITAAARAALSCGERATIAETLLAAGWRETPLYASCGALTETSYTAPDHTITARLITNHHHTSSANGHWLITHAHDAEPSSADAAIPAPVLTAFLLALTDA